MLYQLSYLSSFFANRVKQLATTFAAPIIIPIAKIEAFTIAGLTLCQSGLWLRSLSRIALFMHCLTLPPTDPNIGYKEKNVVQPIRSKHMASAQQLLKVLQDKDILPPDAILSAATHGGHATGNGRWTCHGDVARAATTSHGHAGATGCWRRSAESDSKTPTARMRRSALNIPRHAADSTSAPAKAAAYSGR